MGELPAELIQKILAEADLATVVAAGGVNSAWRAVVKDVSVMYLNRSGFTVPQVFGELILRATKTCHSRLTVGW